jgi:hypothetical protein
LFQIGLRLSTIKYTLQEDFARRRVRGQAKSTLKEDFE